MEVFQVNPISDGFYTIHTVNSGKCLDVAGSSQANGATVYQWSCGGSDNQKWTLVPAPGASGLPGF